MRTLISFIPSFYPLSDIGGVIENGKIFVGEIDTDPEIVVNQKQLYVQTENGTDIAITQPLRTDSGGVPTYSGSTVTPFIEELSSYSLKILDENDVQIYYIPDSNQQVFEPPITTLPISKGGTNSSVSLTNGKVMISDSGSIIECGGATMDPLGNLVNETVTTQTAAVQTGEIINNFSNDGTLVGNSSTTLVTEQAIKAYVDTEIASAKTELLALIPDVEIKAFVYYNGTAQNIINSYNVTGVTWLGTGNYRINFTTPFANADYTALVTGNSALTGAQVLTQNLLAPFASAPTPNNFTMTCSLNSGAALDYEYIYAIFVETRV